MDVKGRHETGLIPFRPRIRITKLALTGVLMAYICVRVLAAGGITRAGKINV